MSRPVSPTRLALAASASLTALAVALPAAADDPIRIGFAIAQSGWMANYDAEPYRGAIMRIEAINAAGGLLGRQIEHRVMDTRTDQQYAATVGQQMVAEGVDLLVVSCDYDMGAPAALAASQAGIMNISLCAGDPKMGLQGVGPYTFTANNSGQTEGIAMAEYAARVMGIETVYILEDLSLEYHRSAVAGFRAAWLQDRDEASILGRDTYMNDDPSIASQITRLRNLDPQPEALYMCSVMPGGGSAIRQIRAAGIDMPILGCTAMVDNYWLSAVPGLTDFWLPGFFSLYGDDPREEIHAFLEAYEARWGEMPGSSYVINGYSMVEAYELAVTRAESVDAPLVAAAMQGFTDEEFLAGPSTYTSELHILLNRPYLMMNVADDSFRAVEIHRPTLIPDMQLLFRIGQ
ncbi:MAG: ABC transporter substrate-binding protein [Pararhodobacter sp.]|nr:ABC transporter substrate-binding protein [Pararhodobacter sp.]